MVVFSVVVPSRKTKQVFGRIGKQRREFSEEIDEIGGNEKIVFDDYCSERRRKQLESFLKSEFVMAAENDGYFAEK